MNNKYTSLVLLVGVLSLSHAEYQIGDSAAVAIGLEASVISTDNVNKDSTEDSDVITSVYPTLQYKSDAGAASIEAYVGQEFITYNDLSENDSEDLKSNVKITFPDELDGENFLLVIEGGYNEYTSARSNQGGQGGVVSTEEVDLSLNTSYYITEDITLRAAFEHLDKESLTTGFADLTTMTIPVALYYEIDESLSAGIGYRSRSSEVGNQVTSDKADSDDDAFFVGIENQVSDIWGYELEVGVQDRNFDAKGIADQDGVFASLLVNWQISDMTELVGELSNEFGTTLANQSMEINSVGVQLNHTFDDRISLSLGLSNEEIEYT
ncbi:MAG: outer membrane beta-barrel protein, partial [Verrucomicrobiota bacterium]|nr:outer membrane beta-barrel protein [Verrucomicrobiota bacterium]